MYGPAEPLKLDLGGTVQKYTLPGVSCSSSTKLHHETPLSEWLDPRSEGTSVNFPQRGLPGSH